MDCEKNNINKFDVSETNDSPPGYGIRHLQTFLLFLGLLVSYSLQVNFSLAIVVMVDKNSTNPDFEEFDWSPSTQSIILSSFFWGYTLGQIPAGELSQRYGPRILLLIFVSISSIMAILTPVAASVAGWTLICAIRLVQGVSLSFVYPCTNTMLAKWTPTSERGRLTTFACAGAQLGTVFMLSISGVLASSTMGWPSIFYLSGAFGVLWSILWFFLGSNSPMEYKYITTREKLYIENNLGGKAGTSSTPTKKKLKTPWKSIFTSVPFLALTLVNCTHVFGFWTFLIEIPTYLKNVMELDIKQNALLSALPYLVMWILSLGFSYISDYFINKKMIGVEASRKLYQSIGDWTPMIILLYLGYVTKENSALAIALLTIAVGISSATYVGYFVNVMDLSLNFAGTLMGIVSFFGNIMGIIAPLLVGIFIDDEKDPAQWRIIFFITAALYFIGNMFFLIFGKAKLQKWNDPED